MTTTSGTRRTLSTLGAGHRDSGQGRHRASVPAVVVLGLLAAAAAAPAQDEAIADLLPRAGIRSVEPPSAATDFELPLLLGGSQPLSAFYGDWVLLTFFASWCAPCATEMPMLEAVSQSFDGGGLSVVGVSIDAEGLALETFVEDYGVEFPVLWDARAAIAGLYQARSIPVSYLIDPAGRIVGVARGARDWSQLGGLFEALLEIIPPGREQASVYDPTGGEVELPIKLTPPEAELRLSKEQPLVGEAFTLEVRIRWAGNFDEYLLHPPEVHLPEAVVQEGVAAESTGAGGGNVVTYRVALRGRGPGVFALDPVELRYTPRFESSPMTSRIEGPTVVVRAPTIAGMAPRDFALVVAGGGLFAAGVVGLIIGWRRRRGQSVRQADSPFARLNESLSEARRLRLQGESAKALLVLAELEIELSDPPDENRLEELRDSIERARFGGEAPEREALDRLQRRVERRVALQAPNPDQVEREALELDPSFVGSRDS